MATMVKEKAKEARNGLQKGIYCVINPCVHFLIKIGFTPNMVTTIGLLGNLAAAAVITYAGIKLNSQGITDWGLLTLAGAMIIGFSLFDMLDGQVARLGNMATSFGAMYDSVLDRYCEMFTLGALTYYFFCCGNTAGAIITFFAMIGSVMVSYTRARAEGLTVKCSIGFMQRPERVVVTALATLAAGIAGQASADFDPNIILIIAMGVIAVFANLTTFARLSYARKQLDELDRSRKN